MSAKSDPSGSHRFHYLRRVWKKATRSVSPMPPEPPLTAAADGVPAVGGNPAVPRSKRRFGRSLRRRGSTSTNPSETDGHPRDERPPSSLSNSLTTNNDRGTVSSTSASQYDSLLVATLEADSEADAGAKLITPDLAVSWERSVALAARTCWEKALDELTDQQRQILATFGIQNTKTFEAEIGTLQRLKDGCTNNLSPGKNPILTRVRIHSILKKMEKYAVIGDIAIQQNPNIVALVWAGVRFCLQVALNDMHTFEAVSSVLEDIASIMGSCRIYERIYSKEFESAKAVITQLSRLYAHCLRFMAEAIDYFHTKSPKRVAEGVTNPFETRFKPLIDEVSNGNTELERRCAVASRELQDEMNECQREEYRQLNDRLVQFRVDILGVGVGVEGLRAHVGVEKRREVLKWLSEVDSGAHHEKAKDLRFNGTGEWLCGKPTFENWVETESSEVMWLYGKRMMMMMMNWNKTRSSSHTLTGSGAIAGSGKTVLSSLVIDTLTETYKSVPTIYFYCDYGESERRQTSSIIGSLLKQLSTTWGYEKLDPQMVSIFDNGARLNVKSSENLLATALSRFNKAFIVVDALDECSEEERKSVVMLLTRQLGLDARCRLKILLTSRPENDLRQLLRNNTCHQIDADDTSRDIAPFVAAALTDHITNKALLDGKVSSALRKQLIETISVQADGMFLWAKLQLDYICKQGNEEEVRAQLTKLPRGLSNTYDRMWARINDADDTERKWALKTLKWVLRAERPLAPEEILEATALEPFDANFDQKRMASSLEYLTQVCGNFVALDEQTNCLRFVHYSVQEFLAAKPEFDSAADLVAEVCLTVLANEKIGGCGRASGTTVEWVNSYNKVPGGHLYIYATRHWQSHCGSWGVIDGRRADLIRRFLLNRRCLEDWSNYHQLAHTSLKSVYDVVSYLNLPGILQHLQQLGPHDYDFICAQSMALFYAAYRGHTTVVKLLLNAGADANAEGIMPFAVRSGSLEVVELLLNAGAVATQNTLQIATRRGFGEVVELLLNAGADANTEGVLRDAVKGRFERIVALLLDAGADPNTRGVLLVAVEYRLGRILKLLLNAGADANAKGALQAAVQRRFGELVELLLSAGANASTKGVLLVAVNGRFERIVALLLNAGADPNTRGVLLGAAEHKLGRILKLLLNAGADANAEGVLLFAVRTGHVEPVELLLNTGADANAEGVLRVAVNSGFERITKLLVNAGANVNAQGTLQTAAQHIFREVMKLLLNPKAGVYAQSALDAVVQCSSGRIVELLLNAGADANTADVMRIAAKSGFEGVVELLLRSGADANSHGELQRAAKGNLGEVVELLLNAGANVNTQAGGPVSALQAAAGRGREQVVELLLKAGADVNAQNGWYGSALQAAARGGFERTVKLLLNAGPDVNSRGGRFGYALRAAARGGFERIVELLLNAGSDANGQGALQQAAKGGFEKIVELLLNAGADPNSQGALQQSARGGSRKVVELLLNAGADANALSDGDISALQAAAAGGFDTVVELLLGVGADVNVQGGWYGSALQASAKGGFETVVKLLLDAGSNVNTQGAPALQAAALGGFEEVVELLLNAGADVNAQGGKRGSALQAAAGRGRERVVELLLNAGADVNAKGGEYGSALQVAAFGGFGGVVKLLVNAGADVNAQGDEYGSALQAAADRGRERVVEILLNAGADVNAQSGERGSALQAAAGRGRERVVEILLNAGADVNAQDRERGSALQAAAGRGRERIVELLLKAGADVNSKRGECQSALQLAADGRFTRVMLLLINAGADLNIQNWKSR